MAVERIETDYLITGAGAMGMAFADVVLAEQPNAEITLVDRHPRAGGHWNDAYSFVSLHQPAAFYGVSSESLGSGGSELASGAEVLAYYERVMRKFHASGRVRFFPMCEMQDDGSVVSQIDPARRFEISARKRKVDATYMNVQVPSIRPPAYHVGEGVSLVPLNGLPAVREPYERYMVIGAGKTGIDAVLFLLAQGVDPDHIHWVMPNDAWYLDRDQIQPGIVLDFFIRPFENILRSKTVDELFQANERDELLLRLDPEVWPTRYRCSTVNRAELAAIRQVRNVVRQGRIERIEPDEIVFTGGRTPAIPKTLYVDCSADGLAKRPVRPVFEEGQINLQSLVMCQQVFSAAAIGHIEGLSRSDEERNALCEVVPHPEVPRDYLSATRGTFHNLMAWAPVMSKWLRGCRLSITHHTTAWGLFKGLRAVRRLVGPVLTRIDEILEADPPPPAAPR